MKTHPVNQGKLCIKGWNLHEHVISDKRLTSPMIKKDGQPAGRPPGMRQFRSSTADRLQAIIKDHGPDSVGVLVSAKITNEENYLCPEVCQGRSGAPTMWTT